MPWVLQSLLTLLAESYCRLILEKEEMWEQRETRLYLVAADEIGKSGREWSGV